MTSKKTIVGNIDPDVLAFTAGQDALLDRVLVEVDCIGSAAHVVMLASMPLSPALFSDADCKRVLGALVEIMRTHREGRFEITPEDQDVHMAVERVLTETIGDLGKRIHTGRSRNDQVALDLRLYAKQELLGLIPDALVLVDSLLNMGERCKHVPMVGRTHLQPAMPSSVGLWATSHAESLLDDLEVLREAYAQNDRCPLGSAAGYGVPLPIDRAMTSNLLDFERPLHNVLYASHARGKGEYVIVCALSQIMLTLGRLAEDMILFMMPEFAYFRLPPAYCTGSSIMPQKQNPDVFELVRARGATVLSCASRIASVLKGLPGGYQRDLQETKAPFMEGLRVTRETVKVLGLVMSHVDVDENALRRGFCPSVFATDKALALVGQGVPFREAYNTVKAELESLESMSPDDALAAKQHEGATAGLNFDALKERSCEHRAFTDQRKKRYDAAMASLLGVPYPDLEA